MIRTAPEPKEDFSFASEPRFWSKVSVGDASQCWEFTACRQNGYGRVRYDLGRGNENQIATRVAWFLWTGDPPPKEMLVCHRCDNPPCVNPHHLFLGSDRDNQHDSVAKRRHAFGERNGQRVLSEAEATAVLARRASGEQQRELAAAFGVTRSAISAICTGRTWSHLCRPHTASEQMKAATTNLLRAEMGR